MADEKGHDPVASLLRLLELEPDGTDRWRVANPDRGYGPRVFGGQVAAQALRAAGASVPPDRPAHSLHAYFLRPGRPGVPITYEVERTRDGRSFTTRRVLARQGAEVIFELSCSFHVAEPGVDYQLGPARDVPAPEAAPRRMLFIPEEQRHLLPMELREIGPTDPGPDGFVRSTRRVWMRLVRPVGDDPMLHACLLTYLSDMGAVLGAVAPVPDQQLARVMGASLDHAMWFHRPLRADRWFLYDLQAVSNAGARGLARGTMHSEDGVLGVSVAQEALLRAVGDDPSRSAPDDLT